MVVVVVVAAAVDDEAPNVGRGSMVASGQASLSSHCLVFSFPKSSAIRNVSLTNRYSVFSALCLPAAVPVNNFEKLSGMCGFVDVCLRLTRLHLLQPVLRPYLSTSSLRTSSPRTAGRSSMALMNSCCCGC